MSDQVLTDKVFKIQIKGEDWSVYVVDEEDNVMVDEDSLAETVFEDKELFFKEITMRTVRHELMHVFISYCYIETASLSQSQSEEVFVEVYAHEADNIDKVAKEIYKRLKQLQGGK